MRVVAFSLFISLLAALAGCQTAGENMAAGEGSSSSAAPPVDYQLEPGLTARERLRKAISLLEVGNGAHAKVELEAYLVEEPNSKLANKLLRQIDADPVKELGEEHFIYRMQPGDSLSTLAKRVLGDAMMFHLLGRYNQIDNPSEMKVGQTIKLPSKPSAEFAEKPAQPDPGAGPTSGDSETEAEQPPLEAEQPTLEAEQPAPEAEQPALEAEQPTLEAEKPPADTELAPLEAEADSIGSLIQQANELSAAGKYKEAAILLEEGLADFPDAGLIKEFAAANYVTFAELLTAEGRLDDANVALRRSLVLDPSNSDVVLRLVENYLAQSDQAARDGESEQAMQLLEEARSLDPDNAGLAPRMVAILLAEAEQRADSGRYGDAAKALLEAQSLDPQNAEIKPRLVAVHLAQAEQLTNGGQYDRAAAVLDRAQALDPDNADITKRLVANHLAHADQLSADGRSKEAIAAVRRAAALDPENGSYNERLAALEQQAKADQLYAKAVAHRTANENKLAYDAYDAVLKAYPDHKRAKKDLLELKPKVANEYHREAMTAYRRQDLDTALGIWDKVLKIKPDHGPAQIYRNEALDLKQKLKEIPEGSATAGEN